MLKIRSKTKKFSIFKTADLYIKYTNNSKRSLRKWKKMIGILVKPNPAISEFFELFKTPWEYYQKGKRYEVVISDDDFSFGEEVRLLFIFNSNPCRFDKLHQLTLSKPEGGKKVKFSGETITILGELSFINARGRHLLETIDEKMAAVQINNGKTTCIRVAYNLFEEVTRLISEGQSQELALNPTLDIHIALLKDWIVSNGINLLEIPPKPFGYDFITCLTHDIDFFFLRNHRADHTMFGLLYRTSLGALMDWVRGHSSLRKLLQRWRFFFDVPLIFAGLRKDPWIPTREYSLVEKDLPTTYFFIPFNNCSGTDRAGEKIIRRACQYEVGDLRDYILRLIAKNNEVGVHGLDAWKDSENAIKELKKIAEITQGDGMGIRIHWLFFDPKTPKILEDAGYLYDSTSGYNDAVGYRNGTVQPFRFPGLNSLMELPLNIQDTSMLYKDRMGLKEGEALDLIDSLIETHKKLGGVLTLNWHDRSLAPERYWGNLYMKVLERLKNEKTLFCTATQAVNWFNQRRAIDFEVIDSFKSTGSLPEVMGDGTAKGLPFLRLYNNGTKDVIDLPLKGLNSSLPNQAQKK